MPTEEMPDFPRRLVIRILRIWDWLIGIRRGFGDGMRVIRFAQAAHLRRPINWFLPILCVILLGLLLVFHEMTVSESSGIGGMMFRVFIFDYLFFFFGLLSGWNMARKWRENSDEVEELSLTPLSPVVVASTLCVGPVTIWLILTAAFCLLDLALPLVQMQYILGFSTNRPFGLTATLVVLSMSAVLVPPVLAWFHFESARLAHWMFAVHALPKVSLFRAAVGNFFLMTMIVLGLSAFGSMVTGFVAMLLSILLEIFRGSGFESYSVWGLGSIAGALAVIWLKRLCVKTYQSMFMHSWLKYQWWGAGESRQPKLYPPSFNASIVLWQSYYGMMEEIEADKPLRRRYWTRRYYLIRQNSQLRSGRDQTKRLQGPTWAEAGTAIVSNRQRGNTADGGGGPEGTGGRGYLR